MADKTPPSFAATWLSRAAGLIGPFALLVFFVPFVILLFYATPALDDFCKASLSFDRMVQHDAWTVTKLSYLEWSARWLTIWLQNAVMHRVNLIGAYGWLLLAVVLTNLAALWNFFRVFFRLNPVRALLVAVGFFAAWLASIDNPAEKLYWLTEVMEYILPLSALLLLVSLLYQARRGAWYYGVVAVLSFTIPAQHEVAGSFLCAILLIGIVAARIGKVSARPYYVSLAFAVPSQVIVMIAPGNALRAANAQQPLWATTDHWHWISSAFYDGLLWLVHPQILLLACCLLLLRESGTSLEARPAPRIAFWATLAIMLAVVAEAALIQIATAAQLFTRVAGWLEFCLWLSFMCLVWVSAAKITSRRWLPAASLTAVSLFAISLFGSSNFRAAVADLRGPAQTAWRLNKARLAQHGGPVLTEIPPQYPKSFMPQFLTADQYFWANQCVSDYLDASFVIVRDGSMVVSDTGWIRDVDHGWLYRFNKKQPDGAVTYWDDSMKATWSTSKSQYPNIFRYSDSAWLWYQAGSRSPRYFYNLTAKKWEYWP